MYSPCSNLYLYDHVSPDLRGLTELHIVIPLQTQLYHGKLKYTMVTC